MLEPLPKLLPAKRYDGQINTTLLQRKLAIVALGRAKEFY